MKKLILVLCLTICTFCFCCCDKKEDAPSIDKIISNSSSNKNSSNQNQSDFDEDAFMKYLEESMKSSSSKTDVSPKDEPYESNQYFDLIDRYTYQEDRYGHYTYIVDKLKGKVSNVMIDFTMIFYDKDENILDKCTPDIKLIADNYSIVCYWTELTEYDHYTISYSGRELSSFASYSYSGYPINMVKYNINNNKVYVTFEQIEDLSKYWTTAQYTLLFFKDGVLVDRKHSFFNVDAKQLTGKGTTDVAEIRCDKEFDTIEYYFEP